jgi:hypothetical protein
MCAVPNMAVFCSFLISCFSDVLTTTATMTTTVYLTANGLSPGGSG